MAAAGSSVAESLKHSRNPFGLASLVQATHGSSQRLGDDAVEIDDGGLRLTQVAHQRHSL